MSGSCPEGNALFLHGCGAGESGLIKSVFSSPRDGWKKQRQREKKGEDTESMSDGCRWILTTLVAQMMWYSLNMGLPRSTGRKKWENKQGGR